MKIDLTKARPITAPPSAPAVSEVALDSDVQYVPRVQHGYTSQPHFGHVCCECHKLVPFEESNGLSERAREKFGATQPLFQIVNGKQELTPAYVLARKEFETQLDARQTEIAEANSTI